MCSCKNKHRCFELQEVATSAAQVNLPDNTRIRNNLITSVYVQPSDPAGTLSYLTPLGRTLASWSVLNSAYLYVVSQNGTTLATLPVASLLRTTENQEPLAVSWAEVDPTQTYIKFNTTAAGYSATAGFVVVFGLACDVCGLSPNSTEASKRLAEKDGAML